MLGAISTAGIGYWWQARLKNVERQDYMGRYRDSLLWAAFDLQSRIYNILFGHQVAREGTGRGFMQAFLLEGSEREAAYVRFSTAFLFAEYLGWAEIFRRDIQFLDLGRSGSNHKVMLCLANISRTLSSVRVGGTGFMLFRADQRAIGELMIADDSEPGQRWCRGYAEFTRKVLEGGEFREWMQPLLDQVDTTAHDPDGATEPLIRLQHQLIELVGLLDPDQMRFPSRERTRFDTERPVAGLRSFRGDGQLAGKGHREDHGNVDPWKDRSPEEQQDKK
ncbi:hypothetical protein ABT061_24935 [Streptosporangium sp. NPDC002544]|uniref:hypothetical protein n=1 Tax=Streptosporangium sp. NPDC002544 TaxID=3154538 RepID=UPI0033237F8B